MRIMREPVKVALLALLLSVSAAAQTAHVIALSPRDAEEAKRLHDAAGEAAKQESEFREHIAKKYTVLEGKKGGYSQFKPGWSGGITYSDDYDFIVPETLVQTYSYGNMLSCCPLTGGSVNPAVIGSFNTLPSGTSW